MPGPTVTELAILGQPRAVARSALAGDPDGELGTARRCVEPGRYCSPRLGFQYCLNKK